MKEAILNVLRLSVRFSERWREGVERFRVHEAERMEVEFSRCSHFLISCLNNVTKRGHFPHCESKLIIIPCSWKFSRGENFHLFCPLLSIGKILSCLHVHGAYGDLYQIRKFLFH